MITGENKPSGPGVECDRKECSKNPTWQMALRIPSGRGFPVEMKLGIWVCDEHKKSAKIDEIMGDEGWAYVQRSMKAAGYAALERGKVILSPIPFLRTV